MRRDRTVSQSYYWEIKLVQEIISVFGTSTTVHTVSIAEFSRKFLKCTAPQRWTHNLSGSKDANSMETYPTHTDSHTSVSTTTTHPASTTTHTPSTTHVSSTTHSTTTDRPSRSSTTTHRWVYISLSPHRRHVRCHRKFHDVMSLNIAQWKVTDACGGCARWKETQDHQVFTSCKRTTTRQIW